MAYELKWKCTCCGQGELCFYSCPTCYGIVLVCSESNNVWSIAGQSEDKFLGENLGGYDRATCYLCQQEPYVKFRNSSLEEIQRRGFTEDQIRYSFGT